MAELRFTYTPPPPPPGGGIGSVSIEVTRPNALVAPALVWLKATGHSGLASGVHSGPVYDAAHHEYHHEWTIDGEPLPAWSKVENLPSAFNNPNKAYGKEVAFVLPAPGDYTISLTVTDRLGNTATAQTGTLTVVSPESYYLDSERIYVDPEGVWAGVPAGATKVQTPDEARLACPSRTSGIKPPWILLRGGVQHDFDTVDSASSSRGAWKNSFDYAFSYLSSYGGGRAQLIPCKRADRDYARGMFEIWGRPVDPGWHIIFTGIDFVGEYDPTVERGASGNAYCINASQSQLQGAFVTIYDVDAYGVDMLLQTGATDSATTSYHAMVHCDLPNGWRNYGSINDLANNGIPTGKLAFIGNRFRQHPDALHGGDKQDAFVNNHGPIRISRAEYAYVAQNDLFSRTGWSPVGGAGRRDDQPCLRLFTSPADGMSAQVERNAMEGGYTTVLAVDANNNIRNPVNMVIENNLMVATAKNIGPHFEAGFSGITARNNLMVYPDTPRHGPNWGNAAIMLKSNNNTADSLASPFTVYNNTVLNLVSAANDRGNLIPFSIYDAEFTNVTEANNVHHVPNGTTPATAQAPIDISTALAGFTPRFKGTRYGYDLAIITLAADVGPGQSFEVPYSALEKKLQEGTLVDGGGPTDQAYWQAIEATDTRHAIYARTDGYRLFAELGHISVTFTATGAQITNNTSLTLSGGGEVRIHLDRTSLIPPMDTTYASPATIPLPVPQPGSPAYQGATSGDVARDDIYRAVRPAPATMGAKEP